MHTPILLFGFLQTSWLEIISFLLALAMVALNIRQSPWGWLFAIISAALYAKVFHEARIYGDMGLQFVFIAVSIWGAYQWLFGGRLHQGITVSHLSRKGWSLTIASWGAAYGLIFILLARFTNSDVAHIDAFLTAGSLVAQFLLARKTLENWHMWITIDLLYIGLYIHKNLYLTAVLYGLFAVLACIGLNAWKKSLTIRAGVP
ncbi:nicotinamide riboside transporter PnuC [Oxalicibacterium faecigallinarum]|uniref:Nicotinamide riboside transporter PnuC n=1 Tax=Oxalicibacterium faecigallinarum TaxID=573741 RepID=A0A8J3ASE6_9BURK|nr:nicotinamide riboside transporter PnuC [Oxalicibacterium faecigallinarum]GGI19070.1 nicotinamide mononucleotide transporter [Oxalicibacterium faecigallinarum]